MKKLLYLSILVLAAGLTACANDDMSGREGCSDTLVKPAPAPMPAPMPVVNSCPCPAAMPTCGCPAREYTVRTPVKVVYQNTTYRTVYEPRTFTSTSYETRPYNRAEVCSGGVCPGQAPVMVQQPGQPMIVRQQMR